MMRHYMRIAFALACVCCCQAPLYSEIDTVTITWNAALCDKTCEGLVKRRLEDIPAVSRVDVSGGQAVMYWKPGQKMTYLMIRRPTQFVGISIDAMYVKVRGTVRMNGDKAELTSIGDGTKFELTSAPAPKYGSYTQFTSSELYKLRQQEIDAFKKAAQEDAMVTASGFLLMPYRLPLTIVLDNYQVEQETE